MFGRWVYVFRRWYEKGMQNATNVWFKQTTGLISTRFSWAIVGDSVMLFHVIVGGLPAFEIRPLLQNSQINSLVLDLSWILLPFLSAKSVLRGTNKNRSTLVPGWRRCIRARLNRTWMFTYEIFAWSLCLFEHDEVKVCLVLRPLSVRLQLAVSPYGCPQLSATLQITAPFLDMSSGDWKW